MKSINTNHQGAAPSVSTSPTSPDYTEVTVSVSLRCFAIRCQHRSCQTQLSNSGAHYCRYLLLSVLTPTRKTLPFRAWQAVSPTVLVSEL